jgi:hypothetical protein
MMRETGVTRQAPGEKSPRRSDVAVARRVNLTCIQLDIRKPALRSSPYDDTSGIVICPAFDANVLFTRVFDEVARDLRCFW